MIRSPRARAGLVAGLAVAGLAACHRTEPPPAPQAQPSAEPAPESSAPLPPDHLLWGELPEGSEKAFGLLLPRTFQVTRRFEREVAAEGAAPPELLANYIRRHIENSSVEVGPTHTIFRNAHPKGGGPPLRIDVTLVSGGSQILVIDLTPPPVPTGLSEAERWRQAGLKSNGELLDPNHVF
jgi:hypothetical protein